MPNVTDQDVEKIIRTLNKLDKTFNAKEIKKIQNKSGAPLIKEMKKNIPKSKEPHHRKDSSGNIVATYYPGNLRRSIRRLNIKGAYYSWYGPKTTATKGEFRGNKVDGWYAHFVEFGLSPWGKSTGFGFTRRALDSKGTIVKNNLIKGLTDRLKEYKRKYERPDSTI